MKNGLPNGGGLYPKRYLIVLILFAFGPRVAQSAGSPTTLPLEHYQQQSLTPARRPSRGKPVEASGPDMPKTYETVAAGSTQYPLDLQTAAEVLNNRIVLANRGSADIVNPWVVVNGKRNWFDAASMVKEALAGETDPERRAFRIWQFIRANRYHWLSAEDGQETHDPVKLLNIYGYGLCDDVANISEAMFRTAGFQDAQCWGLGGHVVPEVYYNFGWHMFDPDLEVFYPTRDGQGVAAADDAMQDGFLVERVSGPAIEQIYTTIEDNQVYHGIWLTSHTMAMTLRPGESLERRWQGWGKFHEYGLPVTPAPPRVGNGIQKYQVPLANAPVARRGLTGLTNLELTSASADVPRLFLAGPAAPGRATIEMRSPYVYVGGRFWMAADLAAAADVLIVEFSRDGTLWTELGRKTGPFTGLLEYSLDGPIGRWLDVACYRFFLRLTFKGTARASASVSELGTEAEIQCSPMALPALEAARINSVSVSFEPAPGALLAVTHEYEVLSAAPADPPIQLNAPQIRIGTQVPALFTWALDSPLVEGFEAMVSRDKDGVLPVAPPLWQWRGTATDWAPDTQFLLPSQKYWWGVRYRDTAGNWRHWSAPQAFSYETINGATAWHKYD